MSKGKQHPSTKKSSKKLHICPQCDEYVQKSQYSIMCSICKQYYHKKDCCGLTHKEFSAYEKGEMNELWTCQSCNAQDSENENDPETDIEQIVHIQNKRLSQVMVPNNRSPVKKEPSIQDILKLFNERFQKFEDSLNFKWEMVEDINNVVKEIQKENKQLKRENEAIKIKVNELERKVEILTNKQEKEENEERKKNVIITGPVMSKDNVASTVQNILEKLKIAPQPVNYKVYLLPSKKDIKPALIKFQNEVTRNEVLKNRKQIGNLDTEMCGIQGNVKRIYISEDLNSDTRKLLFEAKKLKVNHGYKYVWAKNGYVYVRKSENDPSLRIRGIDHLQGLNTQI